MKVFEAPGPYRTPAHGGKCPFCRTMITDEINLFSAGPALGRARSASLPNIHLHVPPPPVRAPPPPGFRARLHNDSPPIEAWAAAQKIDAIVFRGSRVGYNSLKGAFTPPADARFDGPCIIRDKWAERKVTTHMQTKAALAWSKNINKALEYVMGAITAGESYFYVGWIESGIDVLAAVRDWEQKEARLGGPVDAGTQAEVLCESLPINRIIACWKFGSAGYPNIKFVEKIAVAHDAIPSSVLVKWASIEKGIEEAFPLNTAVDYGKVVKMPA